MEWNDNLHILIVEDDNSSGCSLKRLLELSGHRVDFVLDGFDAIEQSKQFNYDYIIMDIRLPGLKGMNGILATKVIKCRVDEVAGSVTKIIGVSGTFDEDIINECRSVGMVGFIEKPIKLPKLIKYLNKENLDGNQRFD